MFQCGIIVNNICPYTGTCTNEQLLVTVGVSPEYDEAKTDLKAAERGLEEYLDRQRQRLGCRVSNHSNPSESAESAFCYWPFYNLGISTGSP